MELTFGELSETPLGPISFAAGENGLRRLAFCDLQRFKADHKNPEAVPSLKGVEVISGLLAALNAYFFGINKDFSVQIDRELMTDFQKQVLEATLEIPYGSIRTYGQVAALIGKPKSARAVGRALATNPVPIVIPCHRVIASDGHLRGYAAPDGITTKAFLLTLEGHQIVEEKIPSFKG